jgi:hypothetical protein
MKFNISMNYMLESFNLTVSYLDNANHRLNIELDLQSLFGLHVHSCTHWLHETPSISTTPAFGLIYESAIGQPR